ncbi:MAG: HupE/UreJ family protein [Octadecabacter sp.]|nr:HupE/UreJ family protein [Octadecabacter sp.]
MVALVWITLASAAAAHEVLPTIGDMEARDGQLVFSLNGNFESIVAGIDLEGLDDTGAAPEAETYDALRLMEPEALVAEFNTYWPTMAEAIGVLVDGQGVPVILTGIEVPEVGDIEVVRQSTLTFTAPLADGAETMQIDWPAEYGVLVLRQQGVEGGWDGYLTGGLSEEVALAGGNEMTGLEGFFRYIPVGVDHIVPKGLDHILFVLGLFLLAARMRPLLWQVSAFTLAHTITLALAALGVVAVSPAIVEPLIALSIVYVAVENVFSRGLNPWRPAIIFGFGLLHGLGFATVLAEYGIPESAFIPSLIGFNVGVEIGQLAVISVAFIISYVAIRSSEDGKANIGLSVAYLVLALVVVPLLLIPVSAMGADAYEAFAPLLFMVAILAGLAAASCAVERYETYRHMVSMPASILIALVGAYWCVERVFL